MKFLQSKFEDYIKENKNENLHTEFENIFQEMNKIDNLLNIIFYGPPGIGKYTQALKYIEL